MTATNSIIVASPINIGTNALFVQASLVWSTCPNPSALPDWHSMLLSNSLCVPASGGYITNGLVAYWRLNDRTGSAAEDSSGVGLDLPLVGSPDWGADYLTLNGTSQFGDAGSNALTNLDDSSMTICAWINTLSASLQGIVAKDYYVSNGDYGGWCFAIESNQLSWNLETGPINDMGSGIVPLGQWMFVAVTWSYTNSSSFQACFYINGQTNSQYNGAGTSGIIEQPSGACDMFVGNLQYPENVTNYPLDGSMRDVAIYKRALSAADILTNFLNTEPSTECSKARFALLQDD